jgi:signal transduction histidine kinase
MTKKNRDISVLLVDDEQGIRNVLGITLEDLGYEVLQAGNGDEALAIFKQALPSIVLTDIKMPGMDGIDLLMAVKRLQPETEVIMITGHGDTDLAIKSLKFEATDFITKPIHDTVLETALKRAGERITMRKQLRDYTQRLESLVEEKTRKLIDAERLAAIGQTVAGLSHSIKNIAGGLKGGAFVLEKGIYMDNPQYLHQGWQLVSSNVEKIARLSLDLLHYAKTGDINYHRWDPNRPAEEVIELMLPRAEEEGIVIDAQLAPECRSFFFDPEGIHRVLLNLVTNALDAFSEADDSSISKKISVRALALEGWGVEYQVCDNGCGMDADTLSKVFQAFFTTKGNNGTGIGLMLSKSIIDKHNGLIEVKSQKGIGSEFIIRLPDRQEPP